MKININSRSSQIFISLLLIICVIIFAYSVVNIFLESNKKEYQKLEEINLEAQRNNTITKKKLDSANEQTKITLIKITKLESVINHQNSVLNKWQKSYDQNLLELKKLKNEKAYIPNNATISEQVEYISNYKHQSY